MGSVVPVLVVLVDVLRGVHGQRDLDCAHLIEDWAQRRVGHRRHLAFDLVDGGLHRRQKFCVVVQAAQTDRCTVCLECLRRDRERPAQPPRKIYARETIDVACVVMLATSPWAVLLIWVASEPRSTELSTLE